MNEIKIAFMGDFFPGGVILNQEKISDDKVFEVLMSADLRVATLECALGPGEKDGYSFDKEKMSRPDWRNIIWAPNESINRLKEFHIDVVTIANNHIFDLGEKGLTNTIRLLDENGIKHCGAGVNKEEAAKPAIVEIYGKKFCFLGYMPYWWEAPHPPTETKAGINMFYIDKVEKDIKKYKQRYDYVFILPHWGIEHTHFPTPREQGFVKSMLRAGADGIIASHTHMVQPLVMLGGKIVCYSLGNFLFPDYYIAENRPLFYPSIEEISTIPSVLGYPKNPGKALKSVWRPHNRIGSICIVKISNKIGRELILTKLSGDNILSLSENRLLRIKLYLISLMLRGRFYKYFLSTMHYTNRFINRLKTK